MTEQTFTKCYKCFRPLKTCYCKYIKEVKTQTRFIFLMHPKEAYKQRTGTGRLASLSLPNSEIIIGIDFNQNPRLNEILNNSQYYCVLLYPDENAWTANKPNFLETIGDKTLVVIVIDATWFLAKKMIRLSTILHNLPKLSFRSGYRSQYKFKQQPQEECLSTIESCYYLIKELQTNKIEQSLSDPKPLLEVFSKMVNQQLECEEVRIASGEKNRYHKSLFI